MRRVLALLLLLAPLAMASACRDATLAIPSRPSAADSADQVIWGLSTNVTHEGVRQFELRADTAYFFDENTRIELRNLRLTFYTEQGVQNAVLTAREGTHNMRTGQMEARGNVELVGEDGRRLESEQLRYDQNTDEISSDSAFVSTEPGRRLQGIGFRASSDLSRVNCLSACRAGGAVTIPQP